MARTTISLEDGMMQELHRLANERRISMAALIREAVEQKLASHRPKPRSLGAGASGQHDTARRAGDERPEPRSWR
jgi:predicted transcriptional regulator